MNCCLHYMLHINLYILYILYIYFITLNLNLKEFSRIKQIHQKLSRKQDSIFG